MLLEVEAQVQQRLLQHSGVVQQDRDEQSSDTSIAVEERVDRLELHVRQRRRHQDRVGSISVVEHALQSRHRLLDERRRRRHEMSVPGPSSTDPVL